MKEKIYKSYFNPRSVAERYAKGRPRYHSFVVQKIKEFLQLQTRFVRTLDVGCGTGFSSVALKEISESVYGCDLSIEMLSLAEDKNNKGIAYSVASGECLPFSSNTFEMITVAQAIHWMNRDKFFSEAERVLKPDCWLIAYDNYFQGKISDEAEFNEWFRESFLRKFPTPKRNRLPFQTESEDSEALILAHKDCHENAIPLTHEELTNYLITITNVINTVENGRNSIEETSNWLLVETEKFFEADVAREFMFSAPIWYFRRERENTRS